MLSFMRRRQPAVMRVLIFGSTNSAYGPYDDINGRVEQELSALTARTGSDGQAALSAQVESGTVPTELLSGEGGGVGGIELPSESSDAGVAVRLMTRRPRVVLAIIYMMVALVFGLLGAIGDLSISTDQDAFIKRSDPDVQHAATGSTDVTASAER